jgi:hypothetical protein
MDIRKDIYPMPEAQQYLEELTCKTREAFPTVFPTVAHVIQYVNNFKSPKIAGLFLDIGNYYNSTKFYTCPKCKPSQSQSCQRCNSTTLEMPPFNKLIMVLAVAEKLASVESSNIEGWVDFYDWVNRKDVTEEYTQVLRKGKFRDFSALMDSLKGRWNSEYANITKVTNFLKTIMSGEEKAALIKTIRYIQAVPELPAALDSEEEIRSYVRNNCKRAETALPVCFELREYWKCYAIGEHGYCRGKSNCPLMADRGKLDKCFKDTVKTIYEWRSKFVHDLQLPPVRETTLFGVRYKGKFVNVEVTTVDFEAVFEGLVMKFFNKFQVTNSKKK